MVVTVATHSSITEEHGALRHNLGRRHNLAPYLKIFFGDFPPPVAKKIFGQCTILGVKIGGGPSGPPNSRGPLVIALTLPYVRYATGHTG